MMEYAGIDAMVTAFLNAGLWTADCRGTATHEGCYGDDCDASLYDLGWHAIDIAPEEYEKAQGICRDFLTLARGERQDIFDGMQLDQVGHDLWLTAQHHGTGFWDRGLSERGDYLTRCAHTYHFESPYIGDDERPHWDY